MVVVPARAAAPVIFALPAVRDVATRSGSCTATVVDIAAVRGAPVGPTTSTTTVKTVSQNSRREVQPLFRSSTTLPWPAALE